MRNIVRVALALAVAALPAVASARGKVYSSENHRPLTGPSAHRPTDVAIEFLRSKGLDGLTTSTLRAASEARNDRTGVTHVRLTQEVEGLRVHGAYAKAAIDDRGQLVHAIDSLVAVPSGKLKRPTVTEAQALATVLAALHPSLAARPALVGRAGNTASFARGAYFHQDPTVERVAVPTDAGLEAGFLVTTWTQKGNLLHESVVSASGKLLSVELRTNTDSYNVFPVDPATSAQTVVNGAPGWLGAGAQTTRLITGDNVRAYLDADNNNAPDSGGVAVTDGNFLAVFDKSVSPTTVSNRDVAIQNLFYLNNVLHDVLYAAGFDEAHGNFQGNDPVNAEAQDGGGTDNANFSTPTDGSSPRMQMYLWTGRGTHEVVSSAGTFQAAGAQFGPALTTTGYSNPLAVAVPADGCTTLSGSLAGKIAIVDRGTCDFVTKVRNAQNAGAGAVIVVNNVGDGLLQMGGTDRKIKISSVFVGQTDGAALKGAAGNPATVRKATTPLQLDGDLDSDIVYHEYGHGLTWRMIGSMSGVFAGAIGEGMSDVLSVILNDDDVVGEYAYSDPNGIRRYPYEGYPLTYGSMNSGTREVHNDGEIYGAIGWKLYNDLVVEQGFSKAAVLQLLVDGMNYTPAAPKMENMRDGILAASADAGVECTVWRAFAHFGVGVGATGTVRGTRVSVVESFTVPSQCVP